MKKSVLIAVVCLLVGPFVFVFSHADEKSSRAVTPAPTQPELPVVINSTLFLPESLRKEVSIEIEHWVFEDFLVWLEETIEISVIVHHQAIEGAAIDIASERIQLTPLKEPVYLLLQNGLSQLSGDAVFYVTEDALHITTEEDAREHQFTAVFNLHELLKNGYSTEQIRSLIYTTTYAAHNDSEGSFNISGELLHVRNNQQTLRETDSLLKALLHPGKQVFLQVLQVHFELQKKLEEKVSVEFVDRPLRDALAILREQIKLPLFLDQKTFKDQKLDLDKPVTLRAKNIKIKSLLESLTFSFDKLSVVIRDGVVLLTSQEVADAVLQIAVYDVSDFCWNEESTESFIQTIQDQVNTHGNQYRIDDRWSIEGADIIAARSGILVIRQTGSMHCKIINWLTDSRNAFGDLTPAELDIAKSKEITTRYYKMPSGIATDLARRLPQLVAIDTWKKPGSSDEAGKVGTILLLKSEAVLLEVATQTTTEKTSDNKSDKIITKETKTNRRESVSHSVLVIKQSNAIHRQIEKAINQVETGTNQGEYIYGDPYPYSYSTFW